MKINAIIQARMSSKRLPGKVLLPVCGKPLLALLIERVQRARSIDGIWVATTTNPSDQAIVEVCQQLNTPTYRGSEDNVLQRVVDCALFSKTDLIVELTGDNPLIDPQLVDDLVDTYKQNLYDFITNLIKPSYTLGMVAQVISTNLLNQAALSTTDPQDQEHVMRYIHNRPKQFKIHCLNWPKGPSRPEFRLTLDTPEDYKLIKILFEALYPQNPSFNFKAISKFLDSNPEILKINKDIVQKTI